MTNHAFESADGLFFAADSLSQKFDALYTVYDKTTLEGAGTNREQQTEFFDMPKLLSDKYFNHSTDIHDVLSRIFNHHNSSNFFKKLTSSQFKHENNQSQIFDDILYCFGDDAELNKNIIGNHEYKCLSKKIAQMETISLLKDNMESTKIEKSDSKHQAITEFQEFIVADNNEDLFKEIHSSNMEFLLSKYVFAKDRVKMLSGADSEEARLFKEVKKGVGSLFDYDKFIFYLEQQNPKFTNNAKKMFSDEVTVEKEVDNNLLRKKELSKHISYILNIMRHYAMRGEYIKALSIYEKAAKSTNLMSSSYMIAEVMSYLISLGYYSTAEQLFYNTVKLKTELLSPSICSLYFYTLMSLGRTTDALTFISRQKVSNLPLVSLQQEVIFDHYLENSADRFSLELMGTNFKWDDRLWGFLIRYYVKKESFNDVVAVLTHMESKLHVADYFVLTALVESAITFKKYQIIEVVLEYMSYYGMKPNELFYEWFIERLLDESLNLVEEARMLWVEMRMLGMKVTLNILNSLLLYYAKKGVAQECIYLWDEMRIWEFVPNRNSYYAMLTLYDNLNDYSQFKNLVKTCVSRSMTPTEDQMNYLIYNIGTKTGDLNFMSELLDIMPKCDSYIATLIDVCIKLGEYKFVTYLFWTISNHNVQHFERVIWSMTKLSDISFMSYLKSIESKWVLNLNVIKHSRKFLLDYISFKNEPDLMKNFYHIIRIHSVKSKQVEFISPPYMPGIVHYDTKRHQLNIKKIIPRLLPLVSHQIESLTHDTKSKTDS